MDDPSVPTFVQTVWECWDNPDFMREYRRLSGDALGQDKRSPLERMIDAGTGHEPPAIEDAEGRRFLDFVREYVWLPVVAKCAQEVSRG